MKSPSHMASETVVPSCSEPVPSPVLSPLAESHDTLGAPVRSVSSGSNDLEC